MTGDHPYTDPGDGRQQCTVCGKYVWPVTHSCKGIRVAPPDGGPSFTPVGAKAVESVTDPADILRRAADALDQAAKRATPGRWRLSNLPGANEVWADRDPAGWDAFMVATTATRLNANPGVRGYSDAAYIALVDPTMGKALAAWLRAAGADWWAHGGPHCADGCMECDDDLVGPHLRRALAVARALLREADDG